MKKLIVAVLIAITLTGCNKQVIDLNYRFDRAIIQLPNGEVIEGKLNSWRDYEGEQLQVNIDGTMYLVSSYNCVLIRDDAREEDE